MITVLVGPEKHRFFVHENLLLDESSLIAGMIARPTEGSIKELRLLETPLEAVEVLVDYLYHSDFASNATWEPMTTLDSFMYAWMLADELTMEDAKNAVMDRLRFTVDMTNTHEIESTSDATLVREAVATMQSMRVKPQRWCPLYTFLIHRLARDLAKSSELFVASTSTALESSFQGTLRKGGDIVVNVFSECSAAKTSRGLSHRPDPAALKGCHFHDHTPGKQSRVCLDVSTKDSADDAPRLPTMKTEPTPSAPPFQFPSTITPRPLAFGGMGPNLQPSSTPTVSIQPAASGSMGMFGSFAATPAPARSFNFFGSSNVRSGQFCHPTTRP